MVNINQKNIIQKLFETIVLGLILFSISETFLVKKSTGQKFDNKSTYKNFKLTQLKLTAKKITVNISSPNTFGSGTIISFEKPFYQVVTNAHVIRDDPKNLIITTSDQKKHRVYSIELEKFKPYDLAVLTFSEQKLVYPVAKFGDVSQLKINKPVVAAGFSALEETVSNKSFRFSQGVISFLASKPLKDGYSIGYTNLIEKGMSGGPLLNMAGELIAINGIHAYPLWGNLYEQNKLKLLAPLTPEQINHLNWGILINNIRSLILIK